MRPAHVTVKAHCSGLTLQRNHRAIANTQTAMVDKTLVLTALDSMLQGSVWGSGSAGVLCAATALLAGNPAFWQVGCKCVCTLK